MDLEPDERDVDTWSVFACVPGWREGEYNKPAPWQRKVARGLGASEIPPLIRSPVSISQALMATGN